jgi:hypothetical protein
MCIENVAQRWENLTGMDKIFGHRKNACPLNLHRLSLFNTFAIAN